MDFEEQVAQLVGSIKKLHIILDVEAKRLRTPEIIARFDKSSQDSWCLSVMGDCLVRLRLFTEQNFNFIETMSVISVARYIFELSIWLKLFERDPRYGLVYYAQLIKTQYHYWGNYRKQLDREISLLKRFEQEEKEAISKSIFQIKQISDPEEQQQAAYNAPKAVSDFIDKQAARHFSIYAEQAKTNGYGLQAYLVKEKVIPEIEKSLADSDQEKAAFDSAVPADVKNLIADNWKWNQMAHKVGLDDEYDFIYRFSSQLLHATPVSITTNQKNLELSELVVFLKYIHVKIIDILELARVYS